MTYEEKLRDKIAMAAMAAIISKMDLGGVNPPSGTGATGMDAESRDEIMSAVSVGAYRYADAMMRYR